MKIGILCSVKMEVDLLLEEMSEVTEKVVDGTTFYLTTHRSKEMVISYPNERNVEPIGDLTESLITNFQPDYVIAIGFAASTNDKTSPLSIVIGEEVISRTETTPIAFDKKLVELFDRIYPSNVKGKIFSSHHFITDISEKREIDQMGAIAIDMGSIKVAEVAQKHGTPCVSIAAITDNANNAALKNYNNYESLAADKLVDLILEGLKKGF